MDRQARGSDGTSSADAPDAAGRRYRSLAASLGDGVFRLDEDGHFVDADDGVADLTGRRREDLLGTHASEVLSDGETARLDSAIDAAIEGGDAETVSLTVRRPDGTEVPVDLTLDAADGQSRTVVGAAERLEHGDADAEDGPPDWQVSTLVENVPGMVYRCRNERGWPMEFVSDAFAELTGYAPEAIERGEISWGEDVMVEEARDHLWDAVQDAVVAGETFSETYRIETADGRIRWVRDYGRAVPVDGSDEVAIEGIIADVTERKRLEAELEEVFGRVTDAFFALDEDWTFTYLNERAHELINPEGRQLEGKKVWDEFPDAVGRAFKDQYERAMHEQETVAFEEYYPDPLDRWFEVRAYPSETGLSVYFRDITERKEREQELEQYETIVETIPDGAYVLDEDHRFTALNGTFAEMTGYDREELLGRDAKMVSTDDGHERGMELRDQLRAGEIDVAVLEEKLEPADGDSFDVELRFTDLRDEEGNFRGTAGAVRDITDRKQREEELRRKERRYEAVFEDPNILVGLLDPDGTVLDINRTAMEYIDADLDAVTGEPFWETPWWRAAADAEVREWVERAADGEYVDFEADLARPDGEQYTLEGYFRPVTNDEGEVVSIIVSDRDVTERKRRERALEESERRYRTLVENFPNGAVALVDENLRYRTVGGDPAKTAGTSADELEGTFIEDVIPEDVAKEVVPRYEAALDGEPSLFEVERDGHFFRFQILPIRDDDGEVFAALGMSQDITERRLHERKIEESERRYRALAEHFPNGIVTLFDHDYEYTLAAGRGFETIGADPADLEGRTFDDVWDGATAETLRPAFEAALDGEERSVELEYEGREWVVHAAPVTDEDGDVFAGMTMAQDITERRAYERRLEESERRYRTLAENFPNGGVGVFDENLRYTLVTGTMWDDIPPDAADLEGQTVREALPPGTADDVEPIFRSALEGETDSVVSQLGGRTYRVWATPLRDASGEITAGQSIAVDITEQLQREDELKASNERLEQFAYAASHDLQEPLRMVSSYLSLIERRYEDDLSEDALEFFEYAVDGAERMREMIDALLEYSRVETQGRPFETVDLNEVAEDARRDLEVRIEESDAEITVGSLPEVEGDEDQLRQVFQNLLDNAIEYSGDDRPRIDIDAERNTADRGSARPASPEATQDRDEWLISVRDEGIGIDAEHTDSVFEVFQRLHTQDEHSGTGIGLALCRRIIERHGGDIWAEPNDEEGTTFYCTLPVSERE